MSDESGSIGSLGGNTKTPKEHRPSGSKRWTFTWNNYPDDWLAPLAPIFQGSEWIGGYEVGESGTPHIQGYIEFPTKVRPIGYRGAPKEIHWGDKDGKPAKGTRAQNVAYCIKEGDVVKESTLAYPRPIKFPTMDKWWQEEILTMIKSEPDDRSIYWYWSSAGNIGKTTFTKYLCMKHKACLLAGKGNDVRNGALTWKNDRGAYPDLCVFPIPKSLNEGYLSYEAIENVKDACFYSGKYEGGTVCDACPHLIVFANFPPDESRLSSDRWQIKNIDECTPGGVGGALRAGAGQELGAVSSKRQKV